MSTFISRAGEKLQYALKEFKINVQNMTCADFGSNVGGFVDCLLQNDVKKVYAVETGYGVLAWNLRNNAKVIVMERSNAMHVNLPEKVDFVSIDVAWTPQIKILPNALSNLKKRGTIVSLVKLHYEATSDNEFKRYVKKGKLDDDVTNKVLQKVINQAEKLGVKVVKYIKSPIQGDKAGNTEYLFYIKG